MGRWTPNISLAFAFFVNAAMLIVAAAVFHFGKSKNVNVADITTAYKLLAPAVGDKVAPKLFAVALLCSGQQSTITGADTYFPPLYHSSLYTYVPSCISGGCLTSWPSSCGFEGFRGELICHALYPRSPCFTAVVIRY